MFYKKEVRPKLNQQINAPSVRLLDSDGTMLGIKPLSEALALARTRGLDLIEIAPQAKPPVCKVLDYSKYCYEKEKQERDARKKQKAGVLKEIRLKPRIASHDLDTKLKHVEEFLREHDKVRVTVIFRGRENQHKDLGRNMLTSIQTRLSPVAVMEGNVQQMGNRMSVTFTPKH
ncbi:MAG: translation initiation factor IF-3 [bacterium]